MLLKNLLLRLDLYGLCLFFLIPSLLLAAPTGKMKVDSIDLGFAINISISLNTKGQSNVTTSAAFSAAWSNKMEVIPFWQVAFNVYHNGVGTSILPSRKQAEFDIVNSLGVHGGMKTQNNIPHINQVRPFNAMTANSVMQKIYAVGYALGTNFIINGHGRNQQVGFINLNAYEHLQLTFYNDGPPFHFIGLGDGYDRWWTGGGNIVVNLNPNWSILEWMDDNRNLTRMHTVYYQFDRFTGDVQDAYTMSSKLRLSKVPTKEFKENFYNQGQTVFGFRHARGLGTAFVLLGQSKIDIQDFIHDAMRIPHHFSLADKVTLLKIDFRRHLYQQGMHLPK